MKVFHYLYYKLFKAAKQSSLYDTAEFTATISFGGLLGANLLVISVFLAKLDILPFLYSNNYQAGFASFVCIVLAASYFLRKKRYKFIIKKYSNESEAARRRGNILVALYVALSFLLIFAVAFFRPGKL